MFDDALQIVEGSRTQHNQAEAEATSARLRAALASNTVMQDRGSMVLCQKRGMANFGHWLIELLPIVHLARPLLANGECKALVPGLPRPMDRIVRESLALLGVTTEQVVFGDGAPRFVEELLMVEGLTAHGLMISPLVMDAMDTLSSGVEPREADRLWVSRAGSVRTLWNETEVMRILEAQGWGIINPGRMAFVDQIAAFKGARRIAGVLGAGLTNIVFAPAGARITSFAPGGMPDTFFWLLSELRRHAFIDVRCPHDTGRFGQAPWDAPLVLSLPQVLEHLGRS